MKTHLKICLTTLAIALQTVGSATADDSQWQAIDNHHGAYTFVSRSSQTGPAIAFGGHAKATRGAASKPAGSGSASGAKMAFHEVTTPHDNVSYYSAPAE